MGGAVESDVLVVCLNFLVYCGVAIIGRGEGGGYVVDDHLDYLDLFLDTGNR